MGAGFGATALGFKRRRSFASFNRSLVQRTFIARFAAHPVAASAGNDPLTLPAYHAMALALRERG